MTSRRNVLQFGAAMLGGILLGAKVEPAAAFGPVRPQKRPLVTGPTKGGRHGQPFGGYFGDIAQRGYVEEEYFVSGEAQRYEPVGALTADGKWAFKPAGTAPFKTRDRKSVV